MQPVYPVAARGRTANASVAQSQSGRHTVSTTISRSGPHSLRWDVRCQNRGWALWRSLRLNFLSTDGPVASRIALDYAGLASATDDLVFSNDGRATFSDEPTPDGFGVDGSVTHLLITPSRRFWSQESRAAASFSAEVEVVVDQGRHEGEVGHGALAPRPTGQGLLCTRTRRLLPSVGA